MTSFVVTRLEYPNRDWKSKPQRDTCIPENGGVKKEVLRQILARNVRERMDAGSIDTQPKLAKAAGVAQSHISRVVGGKQSIGLDVIAALSEAFECQPWELLANDEATRQEAMERMILGPRTGGGSDELPIPPPLAAPRKHIAFKRTKRKG